MTRDNASQFLPLVQALSEGKTIQFNNNGTWTDMYDDRVSFGNEPEHYRIKPQPQTVKVWICKYDDGQICSITTTQMLDYGWIETTATVEVP